MTWGWDTGIAGVALYLVIGLLVVRSAFRAHCGRGLRRRLRPPDLDREFRRTLEVQR